MTTGQATIATPERRATAVGQDVLAAGGTAADAVIAAGAVLCVVYPQMVTIGGDTWTLVGDADGAVTAFNGTGRAPRALNAEAVRAAGHTTMPSHGVHSITVPGLLAGWQTLHDHHGRLPWAELFAPAIMLAEGAAVAPSLARDLVPYADRLALDPGARRVFLDVDARGTATPKRLGDLVTQTALAGSLRQVAAEGATAFYDGDLGARFVAGLAARGATLTTADLAAHRTEVVPPIGIGWRGLEVLSSPPSSQGFTLLKMLALMERLEVHDPLDARQAMTFAAIQALAGAQRDAISADPDEVGVDLDAVLGDAALVRDAEMIMAGAGQPVLPPVTHRLDGDTIGMVATDEAGRWISSVQSVAGTFGSLLLEPGTGILGHNRGGGFSLDPGAPGFLVGGRRPPHTLMPCLVRRDGRLVASLATMGGRSQPTVLAQILTRYAGGQSAHDAVGAPRWLVEPDSITEPYDVLVEAAVPPATQDVLLAQTAATVVEGLDNRFGHAHAVWRDGDGLSAGTEPRADGGDLG